MKRYSRRRERAAEIEVCSGGGGGGGERDGSVFVRGEWIARVRGPWCHPAAKGFMPRRGLCELVFAWNTVPQMMLKKANGKHTLARPRRAHRLERRRRRRMAA